MHDSHTVCNITKQLAVSMFNRKNRKMPGFTLILGAGASISSDCPSWNTLCQIYCEQNAIPISGDSNPIVEFKKALVKKKASPTEAYLAFVDHLAGKQPSLGYEHLANLITQGFFSTIITTNFDSLLERTLARFMSLEDIKVLVRGELSDDRIAQYLALSVPRVKIVKLHGDLTSRIFMVQDDEIFKLGAGLREKVGQLLSEDCLIVGHQMQDLDLLGALLTAKCGSIYYINPSSPPSGTAIFSALNAAGGGTNTIIDGEHGMFDAFFADLNMEVQRLFVKSKHAKRTEVENSIIAKQEKGTGYINYSNLSRLVEDFTNEIRTQFNPDFVVFINDPSAPGGMELKRRMASHLKDVQVETIRIEGEGDSRTYKRCVVGSIPQLRNTEKHKRILILDAISFSGNTLKLALEKMKEWFPNDTIKTGVLILDEHLREEISQDAQHVLKGIISQSITDRHEIFFPWGVTQATSDCFRRFEGLDAVYPVKIAKRPWGTIEILADEQYCSVRVLTIEADKSLSFQRHLCRDEFFISIDENIGLEICGTELKNFSENQSFSDMPQIKSLVLEKGDYLLMPKGIWHRFKASKERVRLLEIGYGLYDQVKDIERLHDVFGREDMDGEV